MDKIVKFKPKQLPGTNRGPAHCRECNHKWEALAPEGTVKLECPECHTLKGVFDYGISPGKGVIWECACGNDLFCITPDGMYCWRCGKEPIFPKNP